MLKQKDKGFPNKSSPRGNLYCGSSFGDKDLNNMWLELQIANNSKFLIVKLQAWPDTDTKIDGVIQIFICIDVCPLQNSRKDFDIEICKR